MISSANLGAMPVNALLRQQTERQAQQAEQQAQALEQQAASKRREARQAEATARQLDAEADQAAAESSLLKDNLATADRTASSFETNSSRLTNAINQATTPDTEQPASPATSLSREINNLIAGNIDANKGNSISFVI